MHALTLASRRLALAVTSLATGVVLGTASPAAADHGALPDGRHVEHYTVRAGDTATGLAVRFHAWTAELISHNHLGSGATLRVGQRLEIPVVTSAVPGGRSGKGGGKSKSTSNGGRKAASGSTATVSPSRQRVRDEVVAASRYYGVDPELALAVSWQEAGWQMHHVSSAGAIGAMQVLPSTGEWMEYYAGRRLHLRHLRDNVAAGVLLLDVLGDQARNQRRRVAAYYQGLGAVREHGLYDDTRGYVANVLAIKRRLEDGQSPA
jgi:hypothetical protein